MHCNSVFKYTCFNCNYSKSKEAKYDERAAFFCDRCAFKTAVGHIYIDFCVLLSSVNNSTVQHANWFFKITAKVITGKLHLCIIKCILNPGKSSFQSYFISCFHNFKVFISSNVYTSAYSSTTTKTGLGINAKRKQQTQTD